MTLSQHALASGSATPDASYLNYDNELARLRSLRNAVIGSRTRKGQLVLQGEVPRLVALLASPLDDSEKALEIRALVATIVGSLAHSASSPTLLALLRAGAPGALITILAKIAKSSKQTNNGASDFSLKLLETILRALRSLLVSLAAEIAPDPRYGLGVGRDPAGNSSSMIRAKSSKEPTGWELAGAGFSRDKHQQSPEASATTFDRMSTTEPLSRTPLDDLTILARGAIATVFSSNVLPLLLGPLFLARIPRHERIDQTLKETVGAVSSRPHKTFTSSESTLPEKSSPHVTANQDGRSVPAEMTPLSARALARSRVLTCLEMTCGILTACLNVPSPGSDYSTSDHRIKGFLDKQRESFSPPPLSPEQELALRRRRVSDFVVEDSPYSTNSYATSQQRTSGDSPEGINRAAAVSDPSKHATNLLEVLLDAAESGFAKAQEAALWALAELTKDSTEVNVKLLKCSTPSGLTPTSMLIALRKDPAPHIRLAAFSCMANLVKAHPFTPKTNECVLGVLVELLDYPGDVQIAAAFVIAKVVADDPDLQIRACGDGYGCLQKFTFLLDKATKALSTSGAFASRSRDNTSLTSTATVKRIAAEETAHRLREAVLTALAALTFTRDEIRRQLIDGHSSSLLPMVVPCLTSSALGTRIAACRLVRALSRSISILRTSLIDAGVAEKLLHLIKDDNEDAEVRMQATATICNLVLSFSPMRKYLLENGGIIKLIDLCSSQHGPTRLNALWAIKNVLYASETDFKATVMRYLGYDTLAQLAMGDASGTSTAVPTLVSFASVRQSSRQRIPDCSVNTDVNLEAVQEQALNIVRNLASSRQEDIEQTLQGFGGPVSFFDLIEAVIWRRSSELVTEQAAYIIVNVATGSRKHRQALLQRANLLDALSYFLTHPRPEVRVAGVWAGLNLTQHNRSTAEPTYSTVTAVFPSFGPETSGQQAIASHENHEDQSARRQNGSPNDTQAAGLGGMEDVSGDVDVEQAEDEDLHVDLGQMAVARLRNFDYDTRLQELRYDPERDVADRARALLRRFE